MRFVQSRYLLHEICGSPSATNNFVSKPGEMKSLTTFPSIISFNFPHVA